MGTLRYAYYPGCSLGSSAKEYDRSLRAVFAALGVELIEIDHWNCCGATPSGIDELLAYSLAARNLAWAEERGLDVVAPCSECFKNLHKAAKAMKTDAGMRAEVNDIIGGTGYHGKIHVKHPLEVVVRDVGLDRIKEHVVAPLSSLSIAPYYGCLISRPRNEFDRPEDPSTMDELFEALGAHVIDFFPYKARCCGGAMLLSNRTIALGMTRDLLLHARERGANSMAIGCPMCGMMLDPYQSAALRGDAEPLPTFYFTQLMGLAMGIAREQLGFDDLVTSPQALFAATVDAPAGSAPTPPKEPKAGKPRKWGEG
jgi:heterodisulfide reductase subunit B2